MRRALRLAVFAVVGLGLLSGGLGACSRGGGGYRVTAYFSSAISLYPHSQVRVLGLRAGHVDSIKVIGSQVRVVMTIPNDIPLPADVSATIIPLSFIGERYVQFFPAWKQGVARLPANSVIPTERTSVPVEPDETLAALKHLLDAIDPQATGTLVKNLAADLDGEGANLNRALAGLGTITETHGSKSEQVAAIIDHFDRLTATLATRDAVLGRVLDNFARTTDALAKERTAIQGLLASLASLATNGLDLVAEHRVKLDHDLTVLGRTLRLVNAHVDQLDKILAAAPILVAGKNLDGKAGLAAAYDRELHALDLRPLVTPNVAQAFQALGLPSTVVCVPVTVQCSVAGTVIVPPDLPDIHPLPGNGANAKAPAAGAAKPHITGGGGAPKGGVGGLIRSISSVFA